jgi:uncharacterized protein (DUF58 family)
VTFAGGLLAAMSSLAFWFLGVGRLDMVLLAAAVLTALLLVLLGVSTLAAALFLRGRGRRAPGPGDLEGGRWNPTGFRLSLRWIPYLSVRTVWERPEGFEAVLDPATGLERVRPLRRAEVPAVARRMVVGDILGLTSLAWRESSPGPVRALPAPAPLALGAALAGLKAGAEDPDPRGGPEGDRVDMRKYGPGDPARMILWKVYARTRKAFVRVPERALEPSPRICAFLPADAGDEPAARLARTVLERGLLGTGWRFGADGAEDAHTLEEALEALARSGSTRVRGGLGPFLERARRDGFGACVLLVPACEGPWAEQVREPLAHSPLSVHVVLALDGWAPPRPPRPFRPRPPRGSRPSEVLSLVDRLVHPGMAATLVDTASGDVLAEPRAWLARSAGC